MFGMTIMYREQRHNVLVSAGFWSDNMFATCHFTTSSPPIAINEVHSESGLKLDTYTDIRQTSLRGRKWASKMRWNSRYLSISIIHFSTPSYHTINCLQHALREILKRLPHTQVSQNLLRTAQDRIELVRAVELLDHASHARLCQTATSKDIDCLVGNLVCGPCGEGLQQANGSAEMLGLLCVGHVGHLVGDGFEPGLVGFDVGDHFGESVEVVSDVNMRSIRGIGLTFVEWRVAR